MHFSKTLLALSLFLGTASMGGDNQPPIFDPANATMAQLHAAYPTDERAWYAARSSAELNKRLKAENAEKDNEIKRLKEIITKESSPFIVGSKEHLRLESFKERQVNGALMEQYLAERTAREHADKENAELRAQVATLQARLDALYGQGGGQAFAPIAGDAAGAGAMAGYGAAATAAAAAPLSPLRPHNPLVTAGSPTRRTTTVTADGAVTIVDEFGLPGHGVTPKALDFGTPPPPYEEDGAKAKAGARTAAQMTEEDGGENGPVFPPKPKRSKGLDGDDNDDVVYLSTKPALTASQKAAATRKAKKQEALKNSAKGTTSISMIFKVVKVEDSTASSSGQIH